MHKYIKLPLLAMAITLPSSAIGQTNIAANRLVVKDSLALKGKWIRQINNDPSLSSSGDNSLSTDAAIKSWLQQNLQSRVVGITTRKDSVLSIDPSNRTPLMVPAPGAGGSSISDEELLGKVLTRRNLLRIALTNNAGIDSIRLTVTSSDSIVTQVIIPQNYNDYIYAYGKPPFSLKGNIPSDSLNNFLEVGVLPLRTYYSAEPNAMTYQSYQYAFKGDPITLDAGMLRGNVGLSLNYIDSTNSSFANYMVLSGHLVNRTTNKTLQVGGFYLPQGVSLSLPKGEQLVSKNFIRNTGSIWLTVGEMINHGNDDYGYKTPNQGTVRARIYKNGALFVERIISLATFNSNIFKIDNTWNSYEIYLDDMP